MSDRFVTVRLPDDRVHEYVAGTTGVEVVRHVLGKKHGMVAMRLDGHLVDLNRAIEDDANIDWVHGESEDGMHILRHSAAHLMAQAVTTLYPNARPTIGPAIDSGFYYDFAMETIGDDDLRAIEKKMAELARANLPITREEHTDAELRAMFADNPFKLEIMEDKLEDGAGSTVYRQGEWADLCLGPHVPQTSCLQHVALTSTSSAYWRADQSRERLVRIHGMVHPTKEGLQQRQQALREAAERDHRRIGRDQHLFHIDETVGQGLVLWTPRGAVIRQALQDFISEHLTRQGYHQVFTPHIGKLALYRASGHYPYYRDSQYPPLVERDLMARLADEGTTCADLSSLMEAGDVAGYLLKPMNCPHHVKIYDSQARSYRDLPLRLAEFGTVYRWEQSGEVSGMTRVRGFTQDDAHLFVMQEQIAEELTACLELVTIIRQTLGLRIHRVRIGLRDPDSSKYVGDPAVWDAAEQACRDAAAGAGFEYTEEPGEAAFYGPKLDFVATDVLGREWQLGTVQVDYNLPERFDLWYQGSDGERHRPVMIHRAPFGSMERFIGVLIEHFNGRFPTWLAPTQAHIISISERHAEYGQQVLQALKAAGIRAEADLSDATLGKKIRSHRKMQPAYLVIVGDDEMAAQAVSVRGRNNEQRNAVPLEQFIEELQQEISDKTNEPSLVPAAV